MRKLFSLRVKSSDDGWWVVEGSVNISGLLAVALVTWLGLWLVSNGVSYVAAAVK